MFQLGEGEYSDKQSKSGQIHLYAWIVAGIFSIWACLLSSYLIYKHFRNYTKPQLQRYIVRIVLMVPIYAVDSWLSLRFKDYSLYFDLVRDCYEAYVLFMFFTFLITYLDLNDEGLLEEILKSKPLIAHPIPFCCLPKFTPGPRFLNWTKFFILQFTLIKPFLTAIALILQAFSIYGDGIFSFKMGFVYIAFIDNLSITLAMYFLVLFYQATKEELVLINPVPKFLCIKAIIMFSFWQGVAIAVIVQLGWIHSVGEWSEDNIATGMQDFLICIEMFLISLAHIYSFGYIEYRNPDKSPFVRSILAGEVLSNLGPLGVGLADTVNPKHDWRQTNKIISSTRREMTSTLNTALTPLLRAQHLSNNA